ncbi:MAG TPA: TetR/AcrR family transcriptional regulator [Pseudonocardiaceae bacterium]|jgi:AcrR family transcriptional regulator|nr:TetR/AcrR family transcriptional regulator [Pseudonocardiaceae bacterium]
METKPTNAGRTARDRARAELTREIKDEARRQLAQGELSLRAVSRALGMVSSALYRYFPSRDDLLTALIIDAYNSLGDAVTEADPGPDAAPRTRWHAVCGRVREWALANRHEYALIYGSPIPGYQAPRTTVAPGTRVSLLLVAIISDGWRSGTMTEPADAPPLPPELAEELDRLSALIEVELPPLVLGRMLMAWTQLFGMVSFELFGQLVGVVDPTGYFFDHTLDEMADFIGLPGRIEADHIGENTQNT